jgi:hypothetical protein
VSAEVSVVFRSAAAVSAHPAPASCASIWSARVVGAVIVGVAAVAARSIAVSATASPATASWRETAVIAAAARCSTESTSCSPWRRR